MAVLSALVQIAPFGSFGAVLATLFFGLNTARHARRDRLATAWRRFRTAGRYAAIVTLVGAEVEALLHDSAARVAALKTLGQLEALARSTSSSVGDWQDVLAPEEFMTTMRFVHRCKGLIEIVRRTSAPVDAPCWTGHRRRAFKRLLRIFRR